MKERELWCLEESAEISFFRWTARYFWLLNMYLGMKTRKLFMLSERVAGDGAEVRGAGD